MRTIEHEFVSRGTACAASLILPDVPHPPVVVMAHGFAAESTFRLPAFAERFAGSGIATFLFDYRNFGGSGGEPRNLVSPRRHLHDWAAAIAFARGLEEVDAGRLALWGTSFSGGHVLVAAAREPAVRAVVSQVPFVDGLTTARHYPPAYISAALAHGLADAACAVLRRPPHRVPVVGAPDRFAMMNAPDSFQGYMALIPEGSCWENSAPARIALELPAYRPARYAARIRCPVLMVCAEGDSLVPAELVARTAARIRDCRLVRLPVGHFDVYRGEAFEQVVELEARFLRESLASRRPT